MEDKNTNNLTGTEKKYSKVVPGDNETKLLNIIGNGVNYQDRVINDREQLKWVVGVFKKEGKKIVYTGGTYDLIHEGHVKYLEEAKKRGDILVVGVDSDELTRLRKPDIKNRPIVGLPERLLMLSHIRSVDILVVLDVHEHQDQLVVDIQPDVAVFSKSTEDITEKRIKQNISDYCGEIVFLEPQATTSTTARIRLLARDGADKLGKEVVKLVEEFLTPVIKEEGKQ